MGFAPERADVARGFFGRQQIVAQLLDEALAQLGLPLVDWPSV